MSGSAIRKIYDALDARNHKAALKLCEKAGKGNRVALALKTLCLQRLGRSTESSLLCDEFMAMPVGEIWSDSQLVSALTMALTSLGRETDALIAWERSLDALYDDSVARELFRLSLRRANEMGPKLRSVAMRLFKETQEVVYLFWVAAIALTEARTAPAFDKSHQTNLTTTLRLAERMTTKAIGSGGYSAQELELVLGIREELNENRLDLLRLAREKSASTDRPPSLHLLDLLEAEAMLEIGETHEAFKALENIVRAKPDDWPAVAALARLPSSDISKQIESVFSQVAQASPEALGPRLGMLELFSHLADATRLREGLCQYLRDRAKSRSCFDDLQLYLAWFAKNGNDISTLALDLSRQETDLHLIDIDPDGAETVVGQAEDDTASQDRHLREIATRMKCARYLGFEETLNCQQLASAALRAQKLGNYDTADDLAVLCYEQARDNADLALTVEACCVLEWARTCRQEGNSPLVELSAMRALEGLGGAEAGLRLYGALGVKQIQLESLGYLLFPWCARCGFFKEAKVHCTNIQTIHRSARSDAGEFGFAALENKNYNTAVDILVFQASRMNPSFQLALARVYEPVLALVTELHTLTSARAFFSSLQSVQSDEVIVNCDLNVWPAWRDKKRGILDGENKKLIQIRFAAGARRYLNVVAAQRELAVALTENGSGKRFGLVLQSLESEINSAQISKEEDDAVRACCSDDYNENDIPWLAHPWAKQLWRTAILGYRFAEVILGTANTSTDAAPALAAVETLKQSLVELREYVFSEKPSLPIVSRIWIAGVCDLLQNVVAPLALIFQACAPSIMSNKKKQHSKKSKAQVVRSPLDTALRAAATQAAKLLADIRIFLRSRVSLLDDRLKDTNDWLPPPPLGLLPPEIATTRRAALRTALIEGQTLAVDRILDIVCAKHAAFADIEKAR